MAKPDSTENLRSSLAAIFKENSTVFSQNMDELESFIIESLRIKLKEIRKAFIKDQATLFNDQCQKLKSFSGGNDPEQRGTPSNLLKDFQAMDTEQFAHSLSPSFRFEGVLEQIKEQLLGKLNKYLDMFVVGKYIQVARKNPEMELDLQKHLKKDIVTELSCGDLNELFEKFQEYRNKSNPIVFMKMKFDFSAKLAYNRFSYKFFSRILNTFSVQFQAQELDMNLETNLMTDDNFFDVCMALSKIQKLRCFSLGVYGNKIGDYGAYLLSIFLKKSQSTLERLHLSVPGNKISAQGFTQLVAVIASCPKLRTLHFFLNDNYSMGEGGISPLFQMLHARTEITDLSLTIQLEFSEFSVKNIEELRPIKMQPLSLPRKYHDVCDKQPKEYSDYENYSPSFGFPDDYEIIKKIGRGKYSDVFEGMNTTNDTRVVIKVLKPGLQIFEYVSNTDLRKLIPTLSDQDNRLYLYKVLQALDVCHSKGIMHRDVKPQNIIVNHERKVLKLIDWGLAEFYHSNLEYNVRVSSRPFKGPELLVDFQKYDYSLDIWSTGAMFASMLFRKEPFFQGNDNYDQLDKIAKVLGTDELYKYLKTYNIRLDSYYDGVLGKYKKKEWSSFVTAENKHLVSEEALDLLSRMLRYDHKERILPSEAMVHKYFDPIRNLL